MESEHDEVNEEPAEVKNFETIIKRWSRNWYE